MRWIARRRWVWVIALWFAAVGMGSAQGWSARRPRVEMPERVGPPIVVSPPDVLKAPPPSKAELGDVMPARPVPGSVSVVLPEPNQRWWIRFVGP